MRRNPGIGSGPGAVAHAMRRNLVGDPFLNAPTQWGVVEAVHGTYSSSLSAACNVGDGTLTLAASPPVNSYLLVGTNPPLRVTAVAGTGPYTATIATRVEVAEPSSTAVTDMKTCDLYLDGSQNLSNSAYLTPGIRWLTPYTGTPTTPTVGDVVVVLRGADGLSSDRVILGKLA